MIPFELVETKLGLKDSPPRLRVTWPASQLLFEQDIARFADPPQICEACRTLGMPDEFMEAALKALHALRSDDVLARYLWHCRRLLTASDAGWPVLGAIFPVIRPDASPAAGMGYALVFLNLFRTAMRRFRERGVEENVALDTLRDFNRWVEEYRAKHGVWGLWNLGWLQNHLRARLFTLGRLQFRMEEYAFDFQAWRQPSTGRVLLLTGDGLPVDPRGRIGSEPVTVLGEDWVRVLKQGDPTVGIHIPAGSPMDFDACGQSFSRVRGFFARHAPDHPMKALTCNSWLLDPQFEGRLPDSSNVVRFLREMYLYPFPGATDDGLFERVFENRRPSLQESETGMTTMQKAVLKFMREGGKWRAGAAVLFPDDLQWGSQVYRRMWPEGIPVKTDLSRILSSASASASSPEAP
jgi:hypothetical protein